MGEEHHFFAALHGGTRRDWLGRMNDDKVHCMEVARRYDRDFFDGDRRYGFGGYRYDGRWLPMARAMARAYDLPEGARVLEVGCGKGFLLYEFTHAVPGCAVTGFDISAYAVANAKEDIRDRLFTHDAADTPWPFADGVFDLVFSVATLHNLPLRHLSRALPEMARVGRRQYLCVESYRTPAELFALQCWALTAESFFSHDDWKFVFETFHYAGDYEFIHF